MLISSCQFSSCWLLSAVCNCRLTVGHILDVNHHSHIGKLRIWGPPGNHQKSIKIPTSPSTLKNEKSEPRVTKSFPKWSPKPPPGHLNPKLSANCKSNKNNCIYYVLSTSWSRRRIPVQCPIQNHSKTNSGNCTPIWWSRARRCRQNDSKVGPEGVPKSIKNRLKARSGPQGVVLGVLGDLRIMKMLPRGTRMHPQDIKMTNYSIQWEA